MASRMGMAAVDFIVEGKRNVMVAEEEIEFFRFRCRK